MGALQAELRARYCWADAGRLPGRRPEWLADVLVRDSRGYILTGRDLAPDGHQPASWPLERAPSLPGDEHAGGARGW
ncbi:MAG: hypothetical protein ACR2JC_17590 [Chloroflexota bacterium]